jgi:hypothetical protein
MENRKEERLRMFKSDALLFGYQPNMKNAIGVEKLEELTETPGPFSPGEGFSGL